MEDLGTKPALEVVRLDGASLRVEHVENTGRGGNSVWLLQTDRTGGDGTHEAAARIQQDHTLVAGVGHGDVPVRELYGLLWLIQGPVGTEDRCRARYGVLDSSDADGRDLIGGADWSRSRRRGRPLARARRDGGG